MLNKVPEVIRRAGRIVTLRHPNSMNCTIWRKRLRRDETSGTLGDMPNIGGVGVLDSEDEADFDYEPIGDAKIVFSGVWQGSGANWNDADTGVLYNADAPLEALIEFVDDSCGHEVQKNDRISIEPGSGIVLIYAVIGENSSVAIPPYVRKFILAERSDFDVGVG